MFSLAFLQDATGLLLCESAGKAQVKSARTTGSKSQTRLIFRQYSQRPWLVWSVPA